MTSPATLDLFESAPSFLQHSLWPLLAPFIVVQYASREMVGRFRLELSLLPNELRVQALAMKAACADCGRPMSPVRARKPPGNRRAPENPGHLYVALACPLETRIGCSRGKRVRDAYQLVRFAVVRREVEAGGAQ